MLKKIFSALLILFLAVNYSGRAQTSTDTVVDTETVDDSLELPRQALIPVEVLREVPARQVRKYLKDPVYAYANDPEYWKKELPPKPGAVNQFFSNPWIRWILFICIIGVVLFGIYQLVKENKFSWFIRGGRQNNPGASVDTVNESLDFEAAIRKYQDEKNYRMAVRFMYLRLLHSAREKGGIQFRDSSTNVEIALAFKSHPKATDFRFLARAYEYIFYGDFIPDQELFNRLAIKFEQFQKSIPV